MSVSKLPPPTDTSGKANRDHAQTVWDAEANKHEKGGKS